MNNAMLRTRGSVGRLRARGEHSLQRFRRCALSTAILVASVLLSGQSIGAFTQVANQTDYEVIVFDHDTRQHVYSPILHVAGRTVEGAEAAPGSIWCLEIVGLGYVEPCTETDRSGGSISVDSGVLANAGLVPGDAVGNQGQPVDPVAAGSERVLPVPLLPFNEPEGGVPEEAFELVAAPAPKAVTAPLGKPPQGLSALPPLPAQGPKINTWDQADKVYNNKRVEPFRVDVNAEPDFTVTPGTLQFYQDGASRIPFLHESGMLVLPDGRQTPVGRYLGGGANSKVYTSSSNPKLVKKFVSLYRSGRDLNDVAQIITDQDGGRAMLEDLMEVLPGLPMRVARRDGRVMIVKAVDPASGRSFFFALSREENIGSPVRVEDPASRRAGQLVTVTNAFDRLRARAPGNDGRKMLSTEEELTVNLVMREMNANGIVWSDHKLQNFDIVPDPSASTGYRMVFFDLDAFRPVRGKDRKARYELARKLQRLFDSVTRQEGMAHLQREIAAFDRSLFADGLGIFDYVAFGGRPLPLLASPGANSFRDNYRLLNFLERENFAKTVTTFNSSYKRNIQFNPPPR